jgi:hypothetical protein
MVKKVNATTTDHDVMDKAKLLLKKTLMEAGVPESHGYEHAIAVYGHLVKALDANA